MKTIKIYEYLKKMKNWFKGIWKIGSKLIAYTTKKK